MFWILHETFLFLFMCLFFIYITMNLWYKFINILCNLGYNPILHCFVVLIVLPDLAMENFSFGSCVPLTYPHLGGGLWRESDCQLTLRAETRQSGAPHLSPIFGMYLLPTTLTSGVISRMQPLETNVLLRPSGLDIWLKPLQDLLLSHILVSSGELLKDPQGYQNFRMLKCVV